MASIDKRRQKRKDGTLGPIRYKVRYRTPEGDNRSKSFEKFAEARVFAASIEAELAKGTWIDPKTAQITFKEYAEIWQSLQIHRRTTEEQVNRHLKKWIFPTIGHMPLASIRRTTIQALVKKLEKELAPSTIEVVYAWVSSIFKAAVMDERLPKSPCIKIKLPKTDQSELVIPTLEQIHLLVGALPRWYRAPVMVSAGTGLRMGEIFGLGSQHVNWLSDPSIQVERQLLSPDKGGVFLGPPKTDSSYRRVPIGETVKAILAQHLAEFPVTHEWGLLFTSRSKTAVHRSNIGTAWVTARKNAGLPESFTFHGLRHFYASALIHHGESVVTVQKRLGHKTPEETLRTYIHLWPDSEERTRKAIDSVFSAPKEDEKPALTTLR